MSKIYCIIRYEKGFVLYTVLPLIAFWMVLYTLGYPKPGVDDLRFVGGPINFIKEGEMANPLLNDVLLAKMFYYFPLFHQYMLAGWLYLFGISTNALLLFQALCYIVISLSTALILSFSGFQRYLVFPITVVLASWMYYMGLRPEALSMACLMGGIAFLTKRHQCFHFVGFALLGASILSYPAAQVYAFSFSLLLVMSHQRVNRKENHYLLKTGGVLLGAIFFIILLYLLFIHFDVSSCIESYRWERARHGDSITSKVQLLWKAVTHAYNELTIFPLYVLFGVLFFEMIRRRKTTPMNLQYIIHAIICGIILSLMLYVKTYQSYVNFFCWVGVVLMISKLPFHTWQRACFIVLALIIFSLYSSRIIISVCGQKTTTASEYVQIRNRIQQNNNKRYMIDHVAARYIFDYRFPANTLIDQEFTTNYSSFQMKSLKQKVSDREWIISSAQPFITELADYQRLNLLGMSFNSIPRKPHDVVIVNYSGLSIFY